MTRDIWDPFEEMRQFRKEMDKTFDRFWSTDKKLKNLKIKQPSIDIEDKKNSIEITAELPGIDKKDIEINVEEKRVDIKAKSQLEKEIKKRNFFRQERSYSNFYRTIPLPTVVNPNKAKTKFKNGVLKINLPKTKQIKRKTIYIK